MVLDLGIRSGNHSCGFGNTDYTYRNSRDDYRGMG